MLDISNNEEYIWTNIFDPTPPTPQEFHKVLAGPTRGNGNNNRHEIISITPSINGAFYYEQKMLPRLSVANNESTTNNEVYNQPTSSTNYQRSSLQIIDDMRKF